MIIIEYVVYEYVDDYERKFVRHTCEDLNEAIEWANFFGKNTSVWSRDLNWKENLVWTGGV